MDVRISTNTLLLVFFGFISWSKFSSVVKPDLQRHSEGDESDLRHLEQLCHKSNFQKVGRANPQTRALIPPFIPSPFPPLCLLQPKMSFFPSPSITHPISPTNLSLFLSLLTHSCSSPAVNTLCTALGCDSHDSGAVSFLQIKAPFAELKVITYRRRR